MKVFRQVAYPEYTGLVVFSRHSFLEDCVKRLMGQFNAAISHARNHGTIFGFPSGATVYFMRMDSKRDAYRVAGMEFQCVEFDPFVDPEVIAYLQSRLRAPSDSGLKLIIGPLEEW